MSSETVEQPFERLLTTPEAASFLQVASGTLRNWKMRGCGPPYRIVGTRLVRYSIDDLRAFAEPDASQPSRLGTCD